MLSSTREYTLLFHSISEFFLFVMGYGLLRWANEFTDCITKDKTLYISPVFENRAGIQLMQYADKAGIGSITLIEVNGLETLGDVSSYSDQNGKFVSYSPYVSPKFICLNDKRQSWPRS